MNSIDCPNQSVGEVNEMGTSQIKSYDHATDAEKALSSDQNVAHTGGLINKSKNGALQSNSPGQTDINVSAPKLSELDTHTRKKSTAHLLQAPKPKEAQDSELSEKQIYVSQMNSHMANLAEKTNGIFYVNGTEHLFSVSSMYCLSHRNLVRRICVNMVVNKWFDRFITLCILANSGLLASKEYDENYDANYHSWWNEVLDICDQVFSYIFLAECVLKIIAMGFVVHKRAYLRDAWNCMDFAIVVFSVISMTPLSNQKSLKIFRTARILRPLRSMHQLKSMRSLLQTFFSSIPGLLNVCIFMAFIFTIFAIIGVNLFVGKQYQFCRATEEPLADGTWPISEDASWQCHTDDMCREYPNSDLADAKVARCGDIYEEFGRDPVAYDNVYDIESINYDITNFNSVINASVTIFQSITLEGWSGLMYNYMDTVSSVQSSVFFVLVVILGAFTTLNLVLASIMHSYLQQEAKEKQENEELMQAQNRELNDQLQSIKATASNNLQSERGSLLPVNMTKTQSQPFQRDLSIIEEAEGANSQYNFTQNENGDSIDRKSAQKHASAMIHAAEMTIDDNEESKQKSNQDIDSASQLSQRLPNLHGQTMTKFEGIKEHQELEQRAAEGVLSSRSSQLDQYQTPIKSALGDTNIAINVLSAQIQKSNTPVMVFDKSNTQIINDEDLNSVHQSHNTSRNQLLNQTSNIMQPITEEVSHASQSRPASMINPQGDLDFDIDYDQIAETRSQRNCCYGFFYELVVSVSFNFLIYCFIVANTVTLALYRYDQSDEQTRILEICDIVFVWVFTVELIMKLIGLGFKAYSSDKFNLFDAVIVVISLVDFTLSLAIDMDSAAGIMSAMRALRLLRVIKLARHWTAFQEILTRLIESIIDISSFSVLLALVLFIFALLGMEIFAFSVYEDTEGETVFGKDNIQAAFARGDTLSWPRQNFNDIFNSFLTVFIVIVAEDWNQIMYLYVRALEYDSESGRTVALFYFLSLFIIGNTIMLALFTALLLKSQQVDMEKLTQMITRTETKKLTREFSKSDEDLENQSPCKKLSNSCSTKACSRKFTGYADTFVKIFGGDHALEKRKLRRVQKDPRSNASPSSGNAVVPSVPQVMMQDQNLQLRKEIDVLPDSSPLKKIDESDGNGATNFNAKNALQQQQSFAFDSGIPTKEKVDRLQRPVALLHYDHYQVKKVTKRSMTIKKGIKLNGKSLFVFKPENPFRNFCGIVSSNTIFDYFIIVCILASTIALAFEHPLEDPQSDMMNILTKIDYVFTGIFCIEATLKIISFGFIMNGKHSYLNNSWNVLDFIIVVLSLSSLVVDAKLSIVKVLRVARILRPLKLLQHAEGLKVAIHALFKSVPQIIRLQTVVFFFMFMISILLTSLLSGKMFHCNLEHTGLQFEQKQELVADKWDCLNYGGLWEEATLNFDNTLRGMLTLFIFQTREGWVGLMDDSIDAVGIDQAGVRGSSPYFVFFYIFLVIVICLLFTNMFVRVVIQTYNTEKDFLDFNKLLTDQQRSWIQVQLMTYAMRPSTMLKTESGGAMFRNLMIKISQSRIFENTIIACIILNTIVMALLWFDQPNEVNQVTEMMNFIFMTIFTLEAIIKLVALKLRYFSDSWNIFDFTIVSLTLMMLLLKTANISVPFGNGPMILRALRIGRILRLIKQARQLQIIFHTLLDSAPSLGSLGLLLLIVFFMFTIIGRSIFGLVKIGDPNEELNVHANFRDFGTSFLLLLRCATGESWHMIMFETAKAYAINYQCREVEDYDTMMANGGEPFACGSPIVSYVFFVLFNLLVIQIFINLFIAIIIDAFLGQTDHFTLPIQKFQLQEFVNIWSHYDPDATGFMNVSDLNQFIQKLAQSHNSCELVILHEDMVKDEALRRHFICLLEIPTYDQQKKVMFYDVLQQLCDKVNLVQFNKEYLIKRQIQQDVINVFNNKKVSVVDARLTAIMMSQSGSQIDFDKTVRQMGHLNPKIKLMIELQKCFRGVHDKYAIYADTLKTCHLTDAERRQMNPEELLKLCKEGQMSKDDVDVLTTKHIYFGTFMQRAIRRFFAKRKARQGQTFTDTSAANKQNLAGKSEERSYQRNASPLMQIQSHRQSQQESSLQPSELVQEELLNMQAQQNAIDINNAQAIEEESHQVDINQLRCELEKMDSQKVKQEDNK